MSYRTVVIDFPWPLKGIGWSKAIMALGKRKRSTTPYKNMDIEDILLFPIDEFAAPNCFFFIWVTSGKDRLGVPIMERGLDIIQRWDATFYTLLTWIKNRGLAPYGPIQFCTEHVVFGYRGKFDYNRTARGRHKNYLEAPWRGHSVKPDEFYEMIREWTPEPRIDLFARGIHEGFDGWGDEYEGGALK